MLLQEFWQFGKIMHALKTVCVSEEARGTAGEAEAWRPMKRLNPYRCVHCSGFDRMFQCWNVVKMLNLQPILNLLKPVYQVLHFHFLSCLSVRLAISKLWVCFCCSDVEQYEAQLWYMLNISPSRLCEFTFPFCNCISTYPWFWWEMHPTLL